MKTLLLAAGRHDTSGAPEDYPVFLAEIDGKLVLEWIAEGLAQLDSTAAIFMFRRDDVRRYHLDSIAPQIVPNARVVAVGRNTAGAPCTALLAIDLLDPEEELLLANVSDLVDTDLRTVVQDFRDRGADAGTVVFESLHPRYSYMRLDDDGRVIEAAEKNPISRHASAGVYWFRRAGDFIDAAKAMIEKDASVHGVFYLSLTFNELVLRGKDIRVHSIAADHYRPFKTNQQSKSFEDNAAGGTP